MASRGAIFCRGHRRKHILGVYHKIKNVPWYHNMGYGWGQIRPLRSLGRFEAKNMFDIKENCFLASNRPSDLGGRIWPHPYPILWYQGTFFILWYTPKICFLLWPLLKMAAREAILPALKTCYRPQFSCTCLNISHDERWMIYLKTIWSKVGSQILPKGPKSTECKFFQKSDSFTT